MAKRTDRADDISGKGSIKKRLLEIHQDVEKAFQDQRQRSDDQIDYWDIYECELGPSQVYNGNAQIYVPIVRNAVDARKTRFTNQIFPKSGRYVECITENGDIPHEETALLEHYVRKAKLRTKVAPALNKNGDIEGQYNVYVFWNSHERHTVYAEDRPIKVGGVEMPGMEEVESIEEQIVVDEYPDVEVIPDADVAIWPATADTLEEAFEAGGGCAILRRWSKAKLKRMKQDEEIDGDACDAILAAMKKEDQPGRADMKKQHVDAAGIKGKGQYYLGYEVWAHLKVDGHMRLCLIYFGGGDQKILGARLNPYWCDLCPLITAPVEKVSGAAKGVSKIKAVAPIQYHANDIANEGADSATLSMLPIIMTDPAKNPKVSTMVLDLAAVWETSPNDTKFASFPALWKDSIELLQADTQLIFQTLSVNPAMIPQSTGSKGQKRNQAEIANEQAVDILTTADAVMAQEEGIWTPIIQRFAEYDAQFRNAETTIRGFGEMGRRAEMMKIKPLQMGRRYEFRWFGVEAARNAAEVQQQIAGMNVIRGIPPEMYRGYTVNFAPLIEHLVMNTYGPRLAPLIFTDIRRQLSVDPMQENLMMREGFEVKVSPFDDDAGHIAAHMQGMTDGGGDPMGTFRTHIMEHQMSMAQKAAAAQPQPGSPGAPGGAGPGMPGSPRPGAQPAAPRQGFSPPGSIRPDSMPKAGAVTMPRKM